MEVRSRVTQEPIHDAPLKRRLSLKRQERNAIAVQNDARAIVAWANTHLAKRGLRASTLVGASEEAKGVEQATPVHKSGMNVDVPSGSNTKAAETHHGWSEQDNMDFANGVLLVHLLEIVFDCSLWDAARGTATMDQAQKPSQEFRKMDLCRFAIEEMKRQGVYTVNQDASVLVHRKLANAVSLMWNLMRVVCKQRCETVAATQDKSDKSRQRQDPLLAWINSALSKSCNATLQVGGDVCTIDGLRATEFRNGIVLNGLLNAIVDAGGSCLPLARDLLLHEGGKNIKRAYSRAQALGLPLQDILAPEELALGKASDLQLNNLVMVLATCGHATALDKAKASNHGGSRGDICTVEAPGAEMCRQQASIRGGHNRNPSTYVVIVRTLTYAKNKYHMALACAIMLCILCTVMEFDMEFTSFPS